jgi:PAS domain S-box-containing protein
VVKGESEAGGPYGFSEIEVAALELRANGEADAEIAERLNLTSEALADCWARITSATGVERKDDAVIRYLLGRIEDFEARWAEVRDVDSRRPPLELEKESGAYFERMLRALREGVVATDLRGSVVYYNPRFAAMCDLADGAGLGRPLQDLFVSGTALASQVESWQRGLASHGDYEVTTRDGRRRWLRFCGAIAENEFGEQTGLVVTVLDVTSRKRLDEALRKALAERDLGRRHLEGVLEAFPLGIAVYARDGELVRANRSMLSLWGQKGMRLPSDSDLQEMDCRWESNRRLVRSVEWITRRLLAGEERVSAPPMSFQRPDRSRLTVQSAGVALRETDGPVAGAVVISIDLTDHAQAARGYGADSARLVEWVESLGQSETAGPREDSPTEAAIADE